MTNLAPELPQTYTRLLGRIPSEDMQVAWRALKWLVCAKRLLTLKELVIAAAILPREPVFNTGRILDHEDMLLDIIGSLVKVNQVGHVEIAHYSVVDFLTTYQFPSDQSYNQYYLDLTATHGEILQSCFNYMNSVWNDSENEPSCYKDSLLRYKTVNWPSHARAVEHSPVMRT
jgi:hypothetical protein